MVFIGLGVLNLDSDGLLKLLEKTDSELLRKAHGQLGTVITSFQAFYETLGIILDGHEEAATQGPSIDLAVGGATPLKEKATIDGADRLGHTSAYITQNGILGIGDIKEFERLTNEQLIGIIAENYHRQRRKRINLHGITISEEKLYSKTEVMKIFDLTPSNLNNILYNNKQMRIEKGGKILGSQIIRYHFRPDGRSKMSYGDFASLLFVSIELIQELADKRKLLRFTENASEIYLRKGEAARFYDTLWERLSKEDLDKRGDYTVPAEGKAAQTGVAVPQYKESPLALDEGYVRISAVDGLNIHTDFGLIKDCAEPHEDASKIRHVGDLTKGRSNVRLNSSDVERLYLARAYIPEGALKQELAGVIDSYDRGHVVGVLSSARILPLLYKGKHVFPPGTLDIIMMTDEHVQRISVLAKPFIDQYGPFISAKEVTELLGEQFKKTEFGKKISEGRISYGEINGTRQYNLFQIAREYETVFRSLANKAKV